MTMICNVPTQLVDAWTRLHRAKENYEALTREVDNFESPQMRVGSGGASSMPPQQRNSIEINAPGEWKP